MREEPPQKWRKMRVGWVVGGPEDVTWRVVVGEMGMWVVWDDIVGA